MRCVWGKHPQETHSWNCGLMPGKLQCSLPPLLVIWRLVHIRDLAKVAIRIPLLGNLIRTAPAIQLAPLEICIPLVHSKLWVMWQSGRAPCKGIQLGDPGSFLKEQVTLAKDDRRYFKVFKKQAALHADESGFALVASCQCAGV
jgi:hypothetical protein